MVVSIRYPDFVSSNVQAVAKFEELKGENENVHKRRKTGNY